MINQLFIMKPDMELIIRCINILGWKDINDKRVLIKSELEKSMVVNAFRQILPEIKLYYLPCKQAKFLENINVKSIITICRQLLKTHGYNIGGYERVITNKKNIIYKLIELNQELPNPNETRAWETAYSSRGLIAENSQRQAKNRQTSQKQYNTLEINAGGYLPDIALNRVNNKFIVCWN